MTILPRSAALVRLLAGLWLGSAAALSLVTSGCEAVLGTGDLRDGVGSDGGPGDDDDDDDNGDASFVTDGGHVTGDATVPPDGSTLLDAGDGGAKRRRRRREPRSGPGQLEPELRDERQRQHLRRDGRPGLLRHPRGHRRVPTSAPTTAARNGGPRHRQQLTIWTCTRSPSDACARTRAGSPPDGWRRTRERRGRPHSPQFEGIRAGRVRRLWASAATKQGWELRRQFTNLTLRRDGERDLRRAGLLRHHVHRHGGRLREPADVVHQLVRRVRVLHLGQGVPPLGGGVGAGGGGRRAAASLIRGGRRRRTAAHATYGCSELAGCPRVVGTPSQGAGLYGQLDSDGQRGRVGPRRLLEHVLGHRGLRGLLREERVLGTTYKVDRGGGFSDTLAQAYLFPAVAVGLRGDEARGVPRLPLRPPAKVTLLP